MADMNLMKSNKRKCQILHLGRNKPNDKEMLEVDQLESIFAEKNLRVLVDTKMNIHQQCCFCYKG